MELKTEGLTKSYGTKIAVDHLNLTLTSGVYGLLGANGAGKTTLMRLLCGLQLPTGGSITLNGRNTDRMGESYRALLGYLPQDFGCCPDFTVGDFLLYMAALKGLEDREAQRESRRLLEEVGLSSAARKRMRALSGGMRQRAGIAQAMLGDPRILILDEPTAGLDPKERVRFRNLITAFAQDRIVILSTHIVSDVEFIAEKIILMKEGRLIRFGSPREITGEMAGRVWEYALPAGEAERQAAWGNSSLRTGESGEAVLRVIADRAPRPEAVQVAPGLEDVYLFWFGEEPKEKRGGFRPKLYRGGKR